MPSELPLVDVEPRDMGFYQNPYVHYAKWHQQHPRFYWEAYGCVCFASFADVDSILRDRRFGRVYVAESSAEGVPAARSHLRHFDALEEHSLLNLERPRHPAMRKLVSRAFASSKVEQLRPQILDIANGLLDKAEQHDACDLLQDYLMPLPALVIARLIGVPDNKVPRLLEWSHAMVKMYTLTQSTEDERYAEVAAKAFRDYLLQLIDEKRSCGADDLLDHLLKVELDSRKLTDAEIISTVVLLLNAGHEATVHQSGNAVKALLEHALIPEDVFASDCKTQGFVEEIMRFDAPLHLFKRYALERVDMGNGLVLEPGQEVALLFGAANRDPQRFTEPNRLLPDRSDAGHVSFGAGVHFCLGAPLARLEMQVSLPLLFRRWPQMRLLEQPLYADSYHFHGLRSLRVKLR